MARKKRHDCYYEPDRGKWRSDFIADGKRHIVRADTPEEVRKLVAERKLEVVSPPVPTFADWAVEWFRANEHKWSYNGREAVRNALNNHLLPEFGLLQLDKITPLAVERYYSSLSGNSKSLNGKIASVFSAVVDSAVENDYLVKSPIGNKKPAGRPSEEKQPLTDSQAARILEAVKGTRAFAFVALGLYAGLRREEILGLMWRNVHLEESPPYLDVRTVLTFEGQKGVLGDALKTPAASRRIPLPVPLVGILSAMPDKSGLVIPDTDGNPCSRTAARNLWRLVENRQIDQTKKKENPDCRRTLDFPCTPHILRHTYITNLCRHSAETGLDIKTIQYLAGHSKVETTLQIYAHAVGIHPEQTAPKIDAVFSGVEFGCE